MEVRQRRRVCVGGGSLYPSETGGEVSSNAPYACMTPVLAHLPISVLEAPVIFSEETLELARHLGLFLHGECAVLPVGALRHLQQARHHFAAE